MTVFEKFVRQLSLVTIFEDIEIKKMRRNLYVTLSLFCVCYLFNNVRNYNHSWTTTLKSLMMKGNFLIQNDCRFIMFFHKAVNFEIFCRYKEQFFLYFFVNYATCFKHISRDVFYVDKAFTLKYIFGNFLVPTSFYV